MRGRRNYVCINIKFRMLFYCISIAGGGREGEGILTAFLLGSYCVPIVFRLEEEEEEEEEEGRGQGMLIVVVSY